MNLERVLRIYGRTICIVMGFVILLSSICIYGVSAIPINATVGENYIHYTWDSYNPCNVYINGLLYTENSTMRELILTNLEEGEKNKIMVLDMTTAEYGELEVVTGYKVFTPFVTFLLLLVLGMYVMSIKIPLIALVGVVLNIVLFKQFQEVTNEGLILISVALLIIVGLLAFGYGIRERE